MRTRSTFKPKLISHYTTVAGLVGIIDSGCMWASNVSFLNDRSELLHALAAAQTAIEKLSSEKALARWSHTLRDVIAHLKEGEIPDTYAICFCHDDDNLSQWRGYGGGEQGVCVTFDRQELVDQFSAYDAKFHKVIYAKFSAPSRVRAALRGELAGLAKLAERPTKASTKARYDDIFMRVSALLPKFKHLGFKDEREWRIVVQSPKAPEDVCFRASGRKIVPYIKLEGENKKLPLVNVRIGPGHDQELTAQSLEVFLRVRGYDDVSIKTSEIPFRI